MGNGDEKNSAMRSLLDSIVDGVQSNHEAAKLGFLRNETS